MIDVSLYDPSAASFLLIIWINRVRERGLPYSTSISIGWCFSLPWFEAPVARSRLSERHSRQDETREVRLGQSLIRRSDEDPIEANRSLNARRVASRQVEDAFPEKSKSDLSRSMQGWGKRWRTVQRVLTDIEGSQASFKDDRSLQISSNQRDE